MSLSIIIKAIPHTDQLHSDDAEVQGEYEVNISEEATPEQFADIALDIFHFNIPVKVLEDFKFEVWAGDKELTPNPDHDGFSFVHLGSM